MCCPPQRLYGEEVTRCLRLDPKPVFALFATPSETSSSKNIPFLLVRKETGEDESSWPSPVIAIVDIYTFRIKQRTMTKSWAVLTYFERGRGTRVPGVAIML